MTETIAPSDAKLETVRKLLAKAERAGSPEEAEAFAEKATALMIKYGIEAATVEAQATRGAPECREIVLDGYAMAKAVIINEVGANMGCKVVLRSVHGRKGVKIALVYGFRADLDAFDLLITSLLLQATTAATAEHKRTPWVHGKTFRHAFLVGFGARLGQRMSAQRVQAEAEATPGTDLVLLDRSQVVAAHVAAQHSDLRAAPATKVDAESFQAGQRAADAADLGGSRIGNKPAARGSLHA